MKIKGIGLAGVLALSTLSVRAQPMFEVSPHFGYRWGGDVETGTGEKISFDAGRAYGLSLDYSPNRESDLKYEVLWSRQDSGMDLRGPAGLNHVGLTIDEFMLGGVVETSYGNLRGYITGLMGASLFGPEGNDSEVRFSISIGGGAKYFLFRNLALRADLRGFCSIVESDSSFISTGGVTVVHFHGSTLWQGEISAGVTLAF